MKKTIFITLLALTCTCYGEEFVKVSEENTKREINSHEGEAEKMQIAKTPSRQSAK